MLAAKTSSDASTLTPFPPDPNSSLSTINTVEREIHEAGGQASTVIVDVRDAAQIQHAVDETVRQFGKLDVLVYNSGAIWWSSVQNTPLKRFRLMQQVNPEGLYATVQAALPVFEKSGWKGRIVVVSPPIYSRFFRGKTAYAMGEFFFGVVLPSVAVDVLM
jgi:NAD(P)-dependent dehydrogenase (short-subunit alcohol dehydrogenase family)